MKKSIAWILTVIMMLALLTGCGSKSAKSDTEYVKKNGKLIVGITDYEPMDYKDENGEWFLNKEKSEWADIPATVIAEFLIQQFGYDAIFNGGKQHD